MSNLPISSPAGFVPPIAVTFSDASGGSVPASVANPLPVVLGGTTTVTLGGSLVLGAGNNTIGEISNSSFAISGSLPGFASPPTVIPTQALAANSTPLTGTAATTATVGPFTPQLGRELRLKLWGTWTGSVQVLSSADAGTTKLPLTASGGAFGLFSTNCNETVDSPSDSADKYYLAITVASGTVNYRLAQ